MTTKFWQNWLKIVMGGVMLYALGLILFPHIMHDLFTRLFFANAESVQQIGEGDEPYIQLVYGVLGAVMVGWMVALLPLVSRITQRDTWNIMAWSIGVWFVLDTSMSLVIGSFAHAVFNLPFFILLAIPLGGIYRTFLRD